MAASRSQKIVSTPYSKTEPFVQSGKAVLVAEYADTGMTRGKSCPKAEGLGFDAILKKRNLGPRHHAC